MKYKFIEHTADLEFKAYGKSFKELFENSATAFVRSFCDDKINPKIKIKINIKGKDYENLLYNFLEELLFLYDSKNFIFSKFGKIKIDKDKKIIEGYIFVDVKDNYSPHIDIKAITYNEMFLKFDGNKWISQVILDV